MWFTPTKTTNNNKVRLEFQVKYDEKMATKKSMRYLKTILKMTLLQKYIKSLKDVKLLESKKKFEWTIAVTNEFGLDLEKSVYFKSEK